MGDKRYIISDASKQVDVESHVLRYWEEELEIDIPRNEMGHRYYTEFHIHLLKNIKDLKEQGFQLKAIKMLLPDLMTKEEVNVDKVFLMKEELNNRIDKLDMLKSDTPEDNQYSTYEEKATEYSTESKIEQFQMIISNIVTKALQENNPELGKEVSERVSDNVIKEMDYLMRMREEKEEDRYKQLDEIIRNVQKGRQEIAYTTDRLGRRKKSKFFKKNNHRV